MVMIQVTTHWFARRAQVRMPGSVLESKGGSILASAEGYEGLSDARRSFEEEILFRFQSAQDRPDLPFRQEHAICDQIRNRIG